MEGLEQGKTWCAVVLDRVSREKLLHKFEGVVPKGWTVSCNHMTINYDKPLNKGDELGRMVDLVAHTVYGSKEYLAVEVSGYGNQDSSQPAHVTIAEPPRHKQSAEHPPIMFREPLDEPIHLRGVVRNVPHDKKFL